MARFWLATFKIDPALERPGAAPHLLPGNKWVLEFIEEGDEYAVLLSAVEAVDDAGNPTKLVCLVGFANGCRRCDRWRGRGFPLMDAAIRREKDVLNVQSAGFLDRLAIDYAARLLTIQPVTLLEADEAKSAPPAEDPAVPATRARHAALSWRAAFKRALGRRKTPPAKAPGEDEARAAPPAEGPLKVVYDQSQIGPDFAAPATRLRQRPAPWLADRQGVRKLAPLPLSLDLATSRLPSLRMFPGGLQEPTAIWAGTLRLPPWPRQSPKSPPERGESTERRDRLVGAAFRFDDVEVLGFRFDLNRLGAADGAEVDRLLERMIKPLNFHRDQESISHFRYRRATRTVSLELLRYGRMRLKKEWQEITVDDFQSQHELLIRILVGRVDDDTGQAHDPATYVPAIFVDNPWSKALGREVQGFDKRLADFCILEDDLPVPLHPDGRRDRDDADPEPLTRIAEVRLTENAATRPGERTLLELDYPFDVESDDDFDEIDLELVLGTSSFAPTRWRQSDFDDVEFRRSFARQAVPRTLARLRSVQASPIGELQLRPEWRPETTLVTGTFLVDGGARLARPNGTVALTLHAVPSSPGQWRRFCRLLGIQPGDPGKRFSFPAGSWYRLRCSMDLDIDNGFA